MQRHHKSNSVSRASATPCVPGEHSRFCARYEQRACTYVTGSRMCCAWLFSRRPAVLSQRTGEARKGRRTPQPVSHARVPCPRVSVPGEPQRNGNALSMPPGRHDHTCPQVFPYPYGTVEALNQLRDGEPLMTLAMDRLASGYKGSMLAPASTDTDDTGASRLLHHEWGVILAGGDGTRLKSLTRTVTGDDRPKQFCALLGDATLLEETQRRAALALAKERTLVVVNQLHESYYAALLSDTPAHHLVAQPCNIGTAPAILYSVLKIAAADPHAIVAVFPSDHYISDNRKFMAHVRRALDTAHVRHDLVILLGIKPDSPEVAYGWIEPAALIPDTPTSMGCGVSGKSPPMT
jgi:Nucleotidyl transferase